jgi:hypothetical protein
VNVNVHRKSNTGERSNDRNALPVKMPHDLLPTGRFRLISFSPRA